MTARRKGEVALASVQLRVSAEHFERPEAFRRMVEDAAARAADACAGAAARLFVFPEGVGYFVPLAFAPAFARRRATVDDAIAVIAAARGLSLLRAVRVGGARSLRAVVMRAILPPVDGLMRSVFSRVARHHGATVVAGSHLRVHSSGAITNTSHTFDPRGYVIATTDKVNLVPTLEDHRLDGLALAGGDAGALDVVDVGWGRVATLICYDGFRVPHTRGEPFEPVAPVVDAAGADVIANPAANSWPWHGRWYFSEPGEQMLRCEQWRQEGLPASLAELGHVRYGVTAHLCGQVMDQAFEGRSEVLERVAGQVRVLSSAATTSETEAVVAWVPAMQFSGG